jgi:hypothetical protein
MIEPIEMKHPIPDVRFDARGCIDLARDVGLRAVLHNGLEIVKAQIGFICANFRDLKATVHGIVY